MYKKITILIMCLCLQGCLAEAVVDTVSAVGHVTYAVAKGAVHVVKGTAKVIASAV